jgi:hypothetical protein
VDSPDIRASDAERDQIAERLGESCAHGRLDISDLVEAAYAARTVRELQALIADLPAPRAHRSAGPRRRPWVPGNRSFAERTVVSSLRSRVVEQVLTTLAPLLVARGYTLVSSSDRLVVFEQARRPAWTILVAVFAFPIGLLALMHKRSSRIVVAFRDEADGTEISAYGWAPLGVRRGPAHLDPVVRAGASNLALLGPAVDRAVAAPRGDLRSGAWLERHRALLDLDEIDLGYRLLTTG